MTEHKESFLQGVPTPPWIQNVTPGTTIQTVNGQAFSNLGDGNYMFFASAQIGTQSFVGSGAAVTVTLVADHGYGVGEAFLVQISGSGVVDGVHAAVATGLNAFAFVSTVTTGFASSTVYLNRKTGTDSGDSIQVAQVLASDVGAENYITLWSRFYAGGGPADNIKRGYGLRLWWKDSTTRVLQILRTDPGVGLAGLQVVAEVGTDSIELFQHNGSDLSVTQKLLLIVADNDDGVSGEPGGVLIRGYVNGTNEDGKTVLAKPTIEYVDRGAGSAPHFNENGTWAITFGKANEVFVDSWTAMDGWSWPDQGAALGQRFRTLSELRDEVRRIVARGVQTQLDEGMLNSAINDAVSDLLRDLGDMATFMRQTETMTFTDVGNEMKRAPGHVEKVLHLWDVTCKQPVRSRYIDRDARGHLLLSIRSASSTFIVQYERVATSMDNDVDYCPVPKRYDDYVRYRAAMFLVEQRKGPDFYASLARTADRMLQTIKSHLNVERRMEDPHLTVSFPEDDYQYSRSGDVYNPLF